MSDVCDEAAEPVPDHVREVWQEVGDAIANDDMVAGTKALEALSFASRYLVSSSESRRFCETHAGSMVAILVAQYPTKMGKQERKSLRQALSAACSIVALDLNIQLARRGDCILLDTVLSNVFNKGKNFYRGEQQAAERFRFIEEFRSDEGFHALAAYLMQRVDDKNANKEAFPELETLQHILEAVVDSLLVNEAAKDESPEALSLQESNEVDAIQIARATMHHLGSLSTRDLRKVQIKGLAATLIAQQALFARALKSRCTVCVELLKSWRLLMATMITSKSTKLKALAWEQVGEMIKSVNDHRPPPRTIVCSGAGRLICNGIYHFDGTLMPKSGEIEPDTEVLYVRIIPAPSTLNDEKGNESDLALATTAASSTALKLTIRGYTVQSGRKRWYLTKVNPGTEADLGYYCHETMCENQTGMPPPLERWISCYDPEDEDTSPTLTPFGAVVPIGTEDQTLEYLLARWMIENRIVERFLRDAAAQRAGLDFARLVAFVTTACKGYLDLSVLLGVSVAEGYARHTAAAAPMIGC